MSQASRATEHTAYASTEKCAKSLAKLSILLQALKVLHESATSLQGSLSPYLDRASSEEEGSTSTGSTIDLTDNMPDKLRARVLADMPLAIVCPLGIPQVQPREAHLPWVLAPPQSPLENYQPTSCLDVDVYRAAETLINTHACGERADVCNEMHKRLHDLLNERGSYADAGAWEQDLAGLQKRVVDSVGCLFAELLRGSPLVSQVPSIDNLVQGFSVSLHARDLLQKLLSAVAEEQPRPCEALMHPFFSLAQLRRPGSEASPAVVADSLREVWCEKHACCCSDGASRNTREAVPEHEPLVCLSLLNVCGVAQGAVAKNSGVEESEFPSLASIPSEARSFCAFAVPCSPNIGPHRDSCALLSDAQAGLWEMVLERRAAKRNRTDTDHTPPCSGPTRSEDDGSSFKRRCSVALVETNGPC